MHSLARLPTYETPFVGRDGDLARLRDAIAAGRRLITLVGAGGVGKTRLAVEHVRRSAESDGDRAIWFCDLTSTRSAEDLCGAVTAALEITAEQGPAHADSASRIGHWLRGRGPATFVLNNFEHLCRFAAFTVGVWRAVAPQVLFLVTSRQPLRLQGETTLALESLQLPADRVLSPEEVRASEAVQLLLARLPPGTVVPCDTLDDARRLAEIVRTLDGLPLAIELAAARLEVLTLTDLHARLPRRFELLRDVGSEQDERHGTLWNAIDWSWNLLTPSEQSVLLQASVFVNGFTLEAGEAVVRLAGEPEGLTVLDAVQGLCKKSLLRADRAGLPGRPARFSFYENIREYGLRKLTATGTRGEVTARWAEYFLTRGLAWSDAVHGPGGADALASLAAEHDNLLAVLRDALAQRPLAASAATAALTALRALGPVLATRVPLAAQVALFEDVIAAALEVPEVSGSLALAHALFLRATAYRFRGRMEEAVADFERAVALARSGRDARLEGMVLAQLGIVAGLRGDNAAARARLETALAIHRREGHARFVGTVLSALGVNAIQSGDLARARGLLDAAMARLEEVGDRRFQGIVHAQRGQLHLEENELAAACERFEKALAIHRELRDRRYEATNLGYLGIARHLEGDLVEARRGYEDATRLLREFGDRRFEGYYLVYRAMLELEEGRFDLVDRAISQALDLLRRVGDPRYEGIALATLAGAHALRGARELAEALLEEAAVALRAAHDPLVLPVLDVHRGLCDLGLARDARAAGDEARAAELEGLARGRVTALAGIASDDVRLAVRTLARAVPALPAQGAPVLRVDAAGQWFEAPGAARVVIARRPVLTRVLAALVRHREEHPGVALPLEHLVRAAWPGTRKLSRTAANRVHVAVSTLRRLGLRDALRRLREGYLLDPAVAVAR